MRSIVLTGVSRGLGAAIFDELDRTGERILALGRAFTRRQLAAAGADPVRVRLRRTDLSDPDSLPGPDELARLLAGADRVALVHNAAVIEPVGAIGTLAPGQLRRAVAVNLLAPMLLTNALVGTGRFVDPTAPTDPGPAVAGPADSRPADAGRTKARPAGTGAGGPRPVRTGAGGPRLVVLFVSSSAAHRVSGGRAVYSATKRGAEMFFDALAAQHAGDPGLYVATVDPGIMDTGMQRTLRRYARGEAYFPDRARFLDRYARGELGSPAEVARKIIAEHLTYQ